MMKPTIEKSIQLSAPPERVWRALTDHEEFGEWFRVDLDGPFIVGETTHGRLTIPAYDGVPWQATVTAMDEGELFAFTWPPNAVDPDVDYTSAPQTTVEFRLEPADGGTRLTITESGFEALPDDERRRDALRENARGWEIQADRFGEHVAD